MMCGKSPTFRQRSRFSAGARHRNGAQPRIKEGLSVPGGAEPPPHIGRHSRTRVQFVSIQGQARLHTGTLQRLSKRIKVWRHARHHRVPLTVHRQHLPQEARVQQSTYLEEAAQALATGLHQQFEESVVIARVFVTVPFGALPPTNKAFVQKLAESAGAGSELHTATPVLSLIGSHGQEADWSDRRKSQGHVEIPLISAAFVDAIPMISRLLKELGVPVDWVDSHDSEMIINTIGSGAGLFFVEDAAGATDQQGRKIIAAQDFVSNFGVKSVFGVGGAYSGGEMIVFVVFCRDAFSRTVAERFLALANLFINKTTSLVEPGLIFAAEG